MANRITITYHGITASVGRWATLLGFDYYALLTRLRHGWSVERALETPRRHQGRAGRTHGKTGSKEYRAWLSMKERCSRPEYHGYHRYGGRGISVCERWEKSFEAFFLDVGPAPSPQHSLGRLDNDGGYEPSNVRWQTAKEQCQNRAKPRGVKG
jgi:hypothetical protein